MLKGVSLEASRGNFNAKYGLFYITSNSLLQKKHLLPDGSSSNSSIEDSG
jgi:hypothetical protein